MRPEPAVLGVVGELALEGAEVRHHVLNLTAHQRRREGLYRAADELIAATEGEAKAHAYSTTLSVELADGVAIDRVGVDRIGSRTVVEREARIARGDLLNLH